VDYRVAPSTATVVFRPPRFSHKPNPQSRPALRSESRINTGWSSVWIAPLFGRQRWLSWQGTSCYKVKRFDRVNFPVVCREGGGRAATAPWCNTKQGLAKRWKHLVHPGGNPGANLQSISHRCHPILVAFVWDLTEETIDLPLGGLQGGETDLSVLSACLYRRSASAQSPRTCAPLWTP